jgi:DNA (cytosine-5)-methyltransferase 1
VQRVTLTVGSLFSGIGGLDLGLERAGMNVIWQSEIDPYACRVLSKHWPEVPNYGDIKTINWGNIVRPDVICGGYPCQPFSTAGKRKGTDDPRHLWPWVRQAISELRPRYAILENVRGHISLGLSTVLGEMASIGYDAEWTVVSAASQGAPHLRERVIIIAYPKRQVANSTNIRCVFGQLDKQSTEARINAQRQPCSSGTNVAYTNDTGDGTPGRNTDRDGQTLKQGRQILSQSGSCGCSPNVAYANGGRLIKRQSEAEQTTGIGFGSVKDRNEWTTEPSLGRVANGVPNRVDRLRGLGNAVVPQVAQFVGELVVRHSQGC